MKNKLANLRNKLSNWEYWPSVAFYWPIYIVGVAFALKNKSLTFFTAVNPSIPYGGIGFESKYESIKLIPEKWRPKTLFIPMNQPIAKTLAQLNQCNFTFPLIAKPDIGARGLLVKKCNTIDELTMHLGRSNTNFLIQSFVDYKMEAGIFCIQKEGKVVVSSVNIKKYLSITGDGISTIAELIHKDSRARLQVKPLEKLIQQSGQVVLPKNEIKVLNQIGNHAKGATFINGNHLIDERLSKKMETIFNQLNGVDYGRLDLKFEDWETFLATDHFKILEINGTCSEPAHIYDQSTMSYFGALKTIVWHWNELSSIAYTNNREKGVDYWNTPKFLKHLYRYIRYIKKMTAIQNS